MADSFPYKWNKQLLAGTYLTPERTFYLTGAYLTPEPLLHLGELSNGVEHNENGTVNFDYKTITNVVTMADNVDPCIDPVTQCMARNLCRGQCVLPELAKQGLTIKDGQIVALQVLQMMTEAERAVLQEEMMDCYQRGYTGRCHV